MVNIIAVTYGRTESGDDLPVLLWKYYPSNEDINIKYKELLPAEFEEIDSEGTNWAPGFVNWNIEAAPEVVDR